jgi:hypothetical protein
MKKSTNIIVSILAALAATYLMLVTFMGDMAWVRHWFVFVSVTSIVSMWNYELLKKLFPKKTLAQTIGELRSKCQYYQVLRSYGLFGDFTIKFLSNEPEWDYAEVVLARNPREAALRAYRRGYGRGRGANFTSTTKNWAKWAVKPLNKPNHFRYIAYFD